MPDAPFNGNLKNDAHFRKALSSERFFYYLHPLTEPGKISQTKQKKASDKTALLPLEK